jgi:hypothetical protein
MGLATVLRLRFTRYLCSVSWLAALIGWGLKGSGDPNEVSEGKMLLLFSAVGFVFSLVLLVGNYSEYYRAKKALRTGNY